MSKDNKLLIDVGNTRVKWGILKEGELIQPGYFTPKEGTLNHMLNEHWIALPQPAEVWAANVAGQTAQAQITDWILAHWKLPVHWATAKSQQLGITNGYVKPKQLGSDRWLALIAAYHQTNSPVCIMDCGSAITVDLVNKNGHHQGGFITPGWHTMTSMMERTFSSIMLTDINFRSSGFKLGLDSTSGVAQGSLFKIVAYLEKIFTQLKADYPDLDCVLTGGDAEIFTPYLSFSHQYQPHLVLEGLGLITSAAAS